MMSYHQPVLAKECVEALQIIAGGVYVDATFGGGGHSALILNQLGDKGCLIGFDQDEDALRNVPDDPRFLMIPHNFRFLKRFLKFHGFRKVDGILADLGVSSHQLDEAARGFSYRFDNELDMRMNRQAEKSAAEIINSYSATALQDMFSRYGEVRNARSLSRKIVEERENRPIRTTGDLVDLLSPLIRGNRQRYLSQVFQALRIEVNDEVGALKDFLEQSLEVLKPGGRLAVITYHSIEDRMVKKFLRTGDVEGKIERDFFGNIYRPFRLIFKKALLPAPAEIKANPRARSAKLRAGEKTEQ